MTLVELMILLPHAQDIQLIRAAGGDLLPDGHYDGKDSISPLYNDCNVEGIYTSNSTLFVAISGSNSPITSSIYISQLPQDLQDSIFTSLCDALKGWDCIRDAVNDAMDSKLCDIAHVIDIESILRAANSRRNEIIGR